ncbi:MAG TPA: hypothetical protein VFV68_11995 [Agriterribacter sp.]|nr:hypothetical protein [Agriterribacter sp.]
MARELHYILLNIGKMVKEREHTSSIKTVLKVDHCIEEVKSSMGEILDQGKGNSQTYYKNISSNSYLFGWIKSFCIVMISVKLIPESKETTIINIEATKPDNGSATGDNVQDAFYDFLGIVKNTFSDKPLPALVWEKNNDNGGIWGFLFLMLLAAFLIWVYFIGK